MADAIIRPKFALRPSRATLAALKDVSIIERPAPHDPAVAAAVLVGIRYAEVRSDGDSFSAAAHLRLGEWMPLTTGVDEDSAFGAVALFAFMVAGIPQTYSAEHDDAERAAAEAVLAAFTAPVSIPLAA